MLFLQANMQVPEMSWLLDCKFFLLFSAWGGFFSISIAQKIVISAYSCEKSNLCVECFTRLLCEVKNWQKEILSPLLDVPLETVNGSRFRDDTLTVQTSVPWPFARLVRFLSEVISMVFGKLSTIQTMPWLHRPHQSFVLLLVSLWDRCPTSSCTANTHRGNECKRSLIFAL